MDLDFYVPTYLMIQEYLDMNQMTKEQLADKVGVSESMMNKIMDGTLPLNDVVAEDISKAFGIEAKYFLDYEHGYREFLSKQKNKKDSRK